MSDPRRTFTSGTGASSIERWSLPLVEGHLIGRPTDDKKAQATAEAIACIAREQAEQRGYEAGMAKAQAEMQPRLAELDARVKKLDALLSFVARPLQELDAEVEKTLLQLTLAVGKQLARRELRVDPAQVIAIIRESLQEPLLHRSRDSCTAASRRCCHRTRAPHHPGERACLEYCGGSHHVPRRLPGTERNVHYRCAPGQSYQYRHCQRLGR